jgi:drug/metabolite transporter (DMT)-like permease
MEKWIVLALLAPALYTMVNFIDKYVVEHKVKDSRGLPIYSMMAAAVFGTSVWLIAGMPILDMRNSLFVLMAGFIAMMGVALYFYALSKSQTSYIVALLQTTPLFTLIFSYALLNERLTLMQFGGFLLIFLAIIGLSYDRSAQKITVGRPFFAILAANVLFALANIAIKFTVDLEGFAPILAYESWGITLGGAFLFVAFRQVRQAFFASFRTVGKQTLAIMFFNESLFIVSKVLTFIAITLGPVALVGVLGGTQVFYGLLYGIVLTLLFPKLFTEQTARRDIARKLLLAAVLFVGIWLIGRA